MSRLGAFEIPDALLQALPLKIARANQYFGSFVRLNCESRNNSQVQLRIYMADWRLYGPDGLLGDSDGPAAKNNPILADLVEAELERVVVDDGNQLSLLFSKGSSLVITSNEDEYGLEDELLIAYLEPAIVKFFPAKGFVLAPPLPTWHSGSGLKS